MTGKGKPPGLAQRRTSIEHEAVSFVSLLETLASRIYVTVRVIEFVEDCASVG